MDTLETALAHILQVEGGFSDHPADPGGATKYGITQATLSNYLGRQASRAEVQALDWTTAKKIYRKYYWDKIGGDELPPPIAIMTMDMAVNSGPKTAVRYLQKAANFLDRNRLVEDGVIGPNTLNAVNQLASTKDNALAMIDEFAAKRGIFYASLHTFSDFGLGWTRRLISTTRLSYIVADSFFAPLSQQTEGSPVRQAALERLTRHFLNNGIIQTYGSFFRLWDGWVTAGHVYQEMNRNVPAFATGDRIIQPGFLDAALFGVQLPAQRPPVPVEGQKLLAIGYPAGSTEPSEREAVVYIRRSSESFIARILSPREPVVVGMSGGIVVDSQTAEPVGIIVVRNSPADLDRDGIKDESFDFVALSDLYDAVSAIG